MAAGPTRSGGLLASLGLGRSSVADDNAFVRRFVLAEILGPPRGRAGTPAPPPAPPAPGAGAGPKGKRSG